MASKELLESLFAQRKEAYGDGLKADDAFEIFCADVILNKHDPAIDEITDRIVDGHQDAGIDSVFLYVNRVLIAEDTDLSGFKYPVDIELIIIQSKNESTFKENPVDKIASSLPGLLKDKNNAAVAGYNTGIQNAFALWHKAITTLAPEFPVISISIWYACKGEKIPTPAQTKASALEDTVRSIFPKASVKFSFAGAADLYELAGQQKIIKAELKISGSPLFGPNNAYIVLTSLSDYATFISDDKKAIRASFFDANVRDYEGNVDVNKDIASTLGSPNTGIDFWWLNNGVTILAANAGPSSGKMTVQNPLIVNGLQTSYEINRWARGGGADEERLVMIRIIETTDEDVINKIIKATNYQTKVKPHSLRGTEDIHRRIEIYLLGHNIYYDRRRNYYKNQGRPAARTIGIDRMAQAVTALLVEQPHVARARPTSLMREPEYSRIFQTDPKEYPLALYRVAAETMFSVTVHMNKSGLDRLYKNNLRFHVLTALGWFLAGSQNPNAEQLASIDVAKISKAPIDAIIGWVVAAFDQTEKTDVIAKREAFTASLKNLWPTSPWGKLPAQTPV